MPIEANNQCAENVKLTLSRAVLIYEGGKTAAATIHPVSTIDGRASILPGVGASISALQSVVFALAKQDGANSYIPDNILTLRLDKLVWWVPRRIAPIYFAKSHIRGDGAIRKLTGRDVTHPPLVFCATPTKLSVFALQTEQRPVPSTPLYVAPYFNIYNRGAMCRGSVQFPAFLSSSCVHGFEKAFYDSAFTHLCSSKATTHPGGHHGYWKAMLTRKTKTAKPKPIRWLVQSRLTLIDVINDNEAHT